jgi:primosomal protein N' (replication factor Y) (superfamily II helicase)
MKIVTVVPFKKGILGEDLTYFTAQNIRSGSIVSVSLRNKKILGLVVNVADASHAKSEIKNASFNLKKISEVKERSIFLKEYLDSVIETSKYFVSSKNNGFVSLIPAPFRENYDKLAKLKIDEKNTENKQKIKTEKLLFQYPMEDRISVYKTLIRESFARGKSIFLVLPTEFDINKWSGLLSKGIEQFVFSLHSEVSNKKIIINYEKIIASSHPVLIFGTPPFLSIPRPDIETIILEHENSAGYKMIGGPHFDLRTFVEIYASRIKAKFILADEMLRFETIERKDLDNLNSSHPLSFRINFTGEIKILGKEPALLPAQTGADGEKFKIFSNESIKEIQNAIAKKKNVFIFSLRKGLATMTVCRDCGETLSCEKCGAPLVLYLSHQGKKRMFVCNQCLQNKDGDTVCPACGSWNLIPLGIGIDTVYEEIKKLLSAQAEFSKTKILKLDKESAKTKKGAEKIIQEFSAQGGSASGGEGAILIGTEMAFFYLKNKVPLSIIASFDSLWNIPNFKMSEKIIQIILSMINHTEETLLIQTKNENDKIIKAVKTRILSPFVREELEDRKKLGYPPFKRFIKITYLGDKEQTLKAKKMLEEIFQEYSPEIFSGFIARIKGKYITNALIKIDPKKWSLPEISANSSIDENLFAKLSSLPPAFEIFVDPEDLL